MLNDKMYSKVAHDLFSFPVLYRSVLTVYQTYFYLFISCAWWVAIPPPMPLPSLKGSPSMGTTERRRGEEAFLFICGSTVFLCGICLVLGTGVCGGVSCR